MLNEWFSSLPTCEFNQADNLAVLVEACQQENMTGLLRLGNHSGDLYIWSFVNGNGNNLFEYGNDSWQSISPSQGRTKLGGNQASISKSQIPLPGMRVCEVLLTAELKHAASRMLTGPDLIHEVQTWFKQPHPGVVHVRGDNLEFFCLMFGDGVPNMEVLYFIGTEAVFAVEQPDDLPVKDDRNYKASYYAGNSQQDVWNKNRLRLAFGVLARMMIQRFGYMVGFVLADRLSAQLTQENQARGLDLKITSNGIENNQLFQSLQASCEAYSFFLNGFFENASSLIGSRMSKEIAMNILEKLNPIQRELLVTSLRELQGPQFNVAGIQRK